MAATVTQPEGDARPRHRRLLLVACTVLLLAVFAGVGVVAFRAYYRLDLFDAYRAGYASVAPLPASTFAEGGDFGGPCRAALAAAYPALDPLGAWPDQATAFWVGCNERLSGSPADPWTVHSSLHDED